VDLREATADERGRVVEALGSDPEILEPEICVASLGRPRLLVPLATRTALIVRPRSVKVARKFDPLDPRADR
jgi:hypothetical protein